MIYLNVTLIYFAAHLVFNAPDRGVVLGHLRKILHRGQRLAKVQNSEEILPKVSTPTAGRMNITDDRRICDSKDPNIM